jgi:hypothetical protein
LSVIVSFPKFGLKPEIIRFLLKVFIVALDHALKKFGRVHRYLLIACQRYASYDPTDPQARVGGARKLHATSVARPPGAASPVMWIGDYMEPGKTKGR